MATLTREDEIALREYQEAGEACRNHDTLVRTGITIFSAAQGAIIGFIVSTAGKVCLELVLLEMLGLWLSVVVWATTRRLSHRYKSYMDRTRCIERRLGMYLYQYSYDYFGMKLGRWEPGNKWLWASVPAVTFMVYVILLLNQFWPSVRDHGRQPALDYLPFGVSYLHAGPHSNEARQVQ